MSKKTALVLSGGGAKGAFQVGAEKYARQVKGYRWDIIAGVSVGALNGAMMAMGAYERLFEIWNTIDNKRVYSGGFNLLSMIKLLYGKRSFYSNQPLQEMLRQEFDPQRISVDFRVGAVSLITGQYQEYRTGDPDLESAILASTVMPIIWEPVNISHSHAAMVDGGLRNISPLGDVLSAEPDEIVVINCSPQTPDILNEEPKDIVGIGLRTLDLLLNEIFQNDLREFARINELVKQAAEQGFVLRHPTKGKALKYYECKIIEPFQSLGDTLDFSQPSVQRSLSAGAERAHQVLQNVKRTNNSAVT